MNKFIIWCLQVCKLWVMSCTLGDLCLMSFKFHGKILWLNDNSLRHAIISFLVSVHSSWHSASQAMLKIVQGIENKSFKPASYVETTNNINLQFGNFLDYHHLTFLHFLAVWNCSQILKCMWQNYGSVRLAYIWSPFRFTSLYLVSITKLNSIMWKLTEFIQMNSWIISLPHPQHNLNYTTVILAKIGLPLTALTMAR